ncbi:MAG: LCP family protein [Armatimonadetes bacterium]|nr:LCP family protein [Armatimonadota bacterium]
MSDTFGTPQRRETETRARSRSPLRRAAAGLALILAICCATAAGIIAYLCLTSRTARDAVGVLVTRNYTPEKAFPNRDAVNILLMGRDLDRDRYGNIVHTRGRTDAMMLAHIDFRDRSASILSIPRDTLVHIPGYRHKRRVSYANAFGGPELATDTINEFVGVHPDYHVLLNFEGFEKAIDAVGGLEVTVDKRLDYDDNWGGLHIHLQPGRRHLNGKQAMGFVRFRKSNDGVGDSDFVRIGRQQELLRSAREKLSSPGVAFKVTKVLDIIRNDMQGNLTPAQMMCLVCFVRSLPREQGLTMESLPALDGGGAFVRADPEATRKLVDQMFLDKQQ